MNSHLKNKDFKSVLSNILSHHEIPLCDECKKDGFQILRSLDSPKVYVIYTYQNEAESETLSLRGIYSTRDKAVAAVPSIPHILSANWRESSHGDIWEAKGYVLHILEKDLL